MIELEVFNSQNKKAGKVELDDKVFGVKVKSSVVHEVVMMERSSQRQGTSATKTRGKVRGGGKKPWRQKGTGRARHGSNRSPIWRGGGVTFGPQPRDYSFSVPKKKHRIAFYGALAAKIQSGDVIVIEPFEMPEPKTREIAKMLLNFKLTKRTLFVVHEKNRGLQLSCRNIPKLNFVTVNHLSPYDLVSHKHILMTKPALLHFNQGAA